MPSSVQLVTSFIMLDMMATSTVLFMLTIKARLPLLTTLNMLPCLQCNVEHNDVGYLPIPSCLLFCQSSNQAGLHLCLHNIFFELLGTLHECTK